MATFNGQRFVYEQLTSILEQLDVDDEVVVVDDASTDDTVGLIQAFADSRIRLFARAENRGYVRTFEEAMLRSRGEYLLLADQDDVWLPGRLDAMTSALLTHAVVASNMVILGTGARPTWWMRAEQASEWRRNLFRIVAGVSGYYGCGMGVRRDFMHVITPFPEFLVESHDLWIAIAGNRAHSIALVERPTLERRVHVDNVTPIRPRSLGRVLSARVMLLRALIVMDRRLRSLRRRAGRIRL